MYNKYQQETLAIKAKNHWPAITVGLILLLIAIHQHPAMSWAETFDFFYDKAQQKVDQQHWQKASELYRKALRLANDPQKPLLQEQLLLCQMNIAVQNRYNDFSVAQQIRQMDYFQTQNLLRETKNTLDKYYKDIDQPQTYKNALVQMQIALNSTQFNDIYQSPKQNLSQLNAELEKIINSNPSDYDIITQSLAKLSDLSQKAGLGEHWPQIEFAYSLISSLDKYSYLLTPTQYEALRMRFDGYFVGLGLELAFDYQWPVVFDIIPDSPAAKAWIQPGDVLLKADNICLENIDSGQISQILTGQNNSNITLIVQRDGKELKFELKRQLLHSPTIRYARTININPDYQLVANDQQNTLARTGFLRISSFSRDTASELKTAIEQLKAEDIDSLIIDLRNNGGGMMNSAIDAADLFLKDKIIVTVKEKNKNQQYRSRSDNFFYSSMELIILVNGNTASAAEIFTAALKDNRRAVVIGNQTFGKAVVQSIYRLDKIDSAVCITTAHYLPPAGFSFDLQGISPDIIIKKPHNDTKIGDSVLDLINTENPSIQTAIKYLQRKQQLYAANIAG